MKIIKLIIILFLLTFYIALAQNLPEGYVTTEEPNSASFQPNKLSMIFNYSNESSGPISLYNNVRRHNIHIGEVYGIIQADPDLSPNSITIRNGNYLIIHDDVNFTVNGEFIIEKKSEIYPSITLINGTLIVNGMELGCNRRNQCVMLIDANNGKINLSGESIITKRRTATTKEYSITAKNMDLLPKNTTNNNYFHFDFYAPMAEENWLGKYRLASGSVGKYLYSDENGRISEVIQGGVHILEIRNFEREVLIKRGNTDLILDYNGKEFLRLHDRLLAYTRESFTSGRLCLTTYLPPSCFNFNPDSGEVNILLRKGREIGTPTKVTINLDNAISKLNIFDIKQDDSESNVIAVKPSIGNRKIVFTRDNVIVDGNWEDFGISFSAFIYNSREDKYDRLECKIEDHACYMNSQPVILRRSAQGLGRCNSDSDCSSLACVNNRCVEPRNCMAIIEPQSRDPIALPINIVFIGDGLSSRELESITRRILYGQNGLFRTEPFIRYQGNFNIMILPNPPLSSMAFDVATDRGLDEGNLGLENCPESEYKVIVSKRAFTSFSTSSRNTCFMSVGHTPEALENRKFVHEFGHCFGNLADEYHNVFYSLTGHPRPPNCIKPSEGRSAENIALTEWTRLLNDENRARSLVEEAKNNWKGCGGRCDDRCNNYLRPSFNSVMRDHTDSGDYNEISRLWLEQKIRNNIIG